MHANGLVGGLIEFSDPTGTEELVAQGRVGVPQLRAAELDRTEGGLDCPRRLEAVAKPHRAVLAPALVGLSAELLDDGLEREAHRQACGLLDRGEQVTLAVEGSVDLGADGLGGRYSWCRGRGSSFVLWNGSKEPTPVARLHQGPDATWNPRSSPTRRNRGERPTTSGNGGPRPTFHELRE